MNRGQSCDDDNRKNEKNGGEDPGERLEIVPGAKSNRTLVPITQC